MFASFETLRSKRVRLAEREKRFTEVEGTPDMVLEVVSDNSVEKDTVRLLRLYWLAGIPEYWLVNAREGTISFEILRRTRSGYVPARKRAGWQPSGVFGKSFKLTMNVDELGYPEFTLGIR
jgi:Uma2 family endonuclease